jgi:hypothetical protein
MKVVLSGTLLPLRGKHPTPEINKKAIRAYRNLGSREERQRVSPRATFSVSCLFWIASRVPASCLIFISPVETLKDWVLFRAASRLSSQIKFLVVQRERDHPVKHSVRDASSNFFVLLDFRSAPFLYFHLHPSKPLSLELLFFVSLVHPTCARHSRVLTLDSVLYASLFLDWIAVLNLYINI